jgi:hypothetical protein
VVNRLALACVLAIGGAAAAEPVQIAAAPAATEPPQTLGFRFGFGTVPLDDGKTITYSLGLGSEVPLVHGVRAFGEYEWLWLDRSHMNEHGDGQRIQLGVRHRLAASHGDIMDLFVDGELGGGLALASIGATNLAVVPDAFVGARVGYDMTPHASRSPSRTFEAELLVRALAVPDGLGWLAGVGMWWGD